MIQEDEDKGYDGSQNEVKPEDKDDRFFENPLNKLERRMLKKNLYTSGDYRFARFCAK